MKYFRFHALRHCGASILDRNHLPLGAFQRILGHESRATTEIYLIGPKGGTKRLPWLSTAQTRLIRRGRLRFGLAGWYNQSYTNHVKTAISVPDPLFEEAEETAKRLGLSRSQLFSKAVKKFLDEHRREGITETLNRVYEDQPSEVDPVLRKMQIASLPREDW